MMHVQMSPGSLVLCSMAASASALISLLPVPALSAIENFDASLPSITGDDFRLVQSVRVTDREGVEIFRSYSDEDRVFLPLGHIPASLINAFVAIEDERFYERPCVDIRAILRAAYSTYVLDDRQGGSTITQQLVRSMTGERDITILRKIREIITACRLEGAIGKEAVMEQYLNRVNFGGLRYGVESASRALFGHPAASLSVSEAAILAAIVQRPTYYVSDRHIDALRQRARAVLVAMRRQSFLGTKEYADAVHELDRVAIGDNRSGYRLPYQFVSLVMDRAGRVLTEEGLPDAMTFSGVTIRSTLDSAVQEQVEQAIDSLVYPLGERFGVKDMAAVVLDRSSRDIVAYVGNADWEGNAGSYWIDMASVPRQPGSAFKPIVYASYMENGKTPDTIISDWHLTIDGISPKNYEGGFLGRMTIRKALAYSRNIPAIRAFLEVGEDRVLRLAASLGAPTPLLEREQKREMNPRFSYGWPLALGSAELPLYELVQAYASLAEGGVASPTRTITSIESSEFVRLYEPPLAERQQIIRPESADAIASILSDWNARPERWNAVIPLPHEWKIGLKTGTSNVCRARKLDGNCKAYGVLNTLAVGFTDRYVIGVIAANADNTQLAPDADGLNAAVPVWVDIVRRLANMPARNARFSLR